MKARKTAKPRRFRDVAEITAMWRSLGAPTFDTAIPVVSWEGFCAVNRVFGGDPRFAAVWVERDSLRAYGNYKGPMYVAGVLGRIREPEVRTVEFIRCAFWDFDERRTVRWLPADWRDGSQTTTLLNAWMRENASEWADGYGKCRHHLPGSGCEIWNRPANAKSCVCDTWGDCVDEIDELTRVAHHTTRAMQDWRLVRIDTYQFHPSERPTDAGTTP